MSSRAGQGGPEAATPATPVGAIPAPPGVVAPDGVAGAAPDRPVGPAPGESGPANPVLGGPGSPAPASRAGRLWVAVVAGILVLVILLVFIFQNLRDVRVHFFTANGEFPLALALLFAVVLGALTVISIGTVRILQLRRAVHRRPDPAP